MPFVVYPQQILGMKIKGRLGKPNNYGWSMYGWSEYGDDNIFSAAYQSRRNRKGDWDVEGITFGKIRNFLMRPTWPVDTPSEARTVQRAKFSTALLMWQALTAEQKAYYNTYATRISKRGYDYFMSKTLKSL